MDTKGDLISTLNHRLTLGERFLKTYKEDVEKWEKDYQIKTLLNSKIEGMDNLMQIPYIFSTIETSLPTIFDSVPSLIMKHRGVKDREFTEFTAKIWDYVKDRLQLEEKVEEAGTNFLVTGLGTVKYGWDYGYVDVENPQETPINNSDGSPVTDETGQPVTQIVNQKVKIPKTNMPFIKVQNFRQIIFSPESVFAEDDEENLIPYIILKRIITKEKAEKDYDATFKDEDMETLDLKEIDKKLEENLIDKDLIESPDMKRVTVYEYYGILPKEFSKDKNWTADQVYYCVFTKKEVKKDPVQINKKPFALMGNYGLPTHFWRFGEPKVLRELEQDISFGRSRIMDIRDKQGTKIALPTGTEVDERALQKSRDFTIMRYMGNNPPSYVNPPPIPETILTALEQSKSDIQMASATLDISRGGMESTVDTATGQKIFQAASDKRNQRKRKKIGRFVRTIAKNLLVMCGQNWDVQEFAQITDMDPQELTQKGYVDLLAQLGKEYDVEIDYETTTNNEAAEGAQAIALYREMKDDPAVNHEELVKFTIKKGFKQKDVETFLSGVVSPETMNKVIEQLMQSGIIDPQMAQVMGQRLQQQIQPAVTGQGEGRPAVNTPTSIVEKGMPGTNNTQMNAQANAAFKQTGVSKGPQINRRG
jgi:hypothetical protein